MHFWSNSSLFSLNYNKIWNFGKLCYFYNLHSVDIHSKNHEYVFWDCESLSRRNVSVVWRKISSETLGHFRYFYNLHIAGFFYSINRAYILCGKWKVILTLFLDWIWVMSELAFPPKILYS